ncbi:MAG TPA: hypothetical protein VG713_19935 [Pirellulales bacterium]|nr:hypothetical protein [Pirellulales bacterium]
MNSMEHVEGVIILGLALVAVAVASALRGLYIRSNIPFLARKKTEGAQQPATVPATALIAAPRKAA